MRIPEAREPANNALEKHVIWISGEAWDNTGGAHRAMAIALSAYARILWVDPPASPLTPNKNKRIAKPALIEATDRITRLRPVALPGSSRLGIRATTPTLVRAQVCWAVRKFGLRPNAVVMLYLGGLLGGWGEGVTNVMFGTDDYVAGAQLMGLSAGHLRKRERQALSKADVVVAVSEVLARRWSEMGTKPVVIPNGCWPLTSRLSAEDTDLPRPVAGLVGRLSERVDLDIIDTIADSGQSLLLIGPHDPRWELERFRKLVKKPSVRHTGPIANAEVPARLAALDVGITPYRDSAFNRASFPLKTLEYLSAGVPVVTTSLPSMRWLRADLEKVVPTDLADQILVLAGDGDDFVKTIHDMAEHSREVTDHCIAFAERHSWPRRAERLAAEIGLLSTCQGSKLGLCPKDRRSEL